MRKSLTRDSALSDGHLVKNDQKLAHPRYELLFGSLQSQKSKHLLGLHKKYKERLMQPLQINNKLRVLNELDFLVPEKDFLTWVQFNGIENNPEVDRLLDKVKGITNFSKKALKDQRGLADKSIMSTSRRVDTKEDGDEVLKRNLDADLYEKIKMAKNRRNSMTDVSGNYEISMNTIGDVSPKVAVEEQQQVTFEGIEGEEEIVSKQISMIHPDNKALKQLKNNVHFRYTNRKMLLLRSLDLLPKKDEIVKTFFQKKENNYLEREQEYQEKLKQRMSHDTRLILTHKKDFTKLQNKLKGKINDGSQSERGPSVMPLRPRYNENESIMTHRRTSIEQGNVFVTSTSNHLDDAGSLNRLETDGSEIGRFRSCTIDEDRSENNMVNQAENIGIISYGNFGKKLMRSQSISRFYRQPANELGGGHKRSHSRIGISTKGARKISTLINSGTELKQREQASMLTGRSYLQKKKDQKLVPVKPSQNLAELAKQMNENSFTSGRVSYCSAALTQDNTPVPGSINSDRINSETSLGGKVKTRIIRRGSVIIDSRTSLDEAVGSMKNIETETEALLNK